MAPSEHAHGEAERIPGPAVTTPAPGTGERCPRCASPLGPSWLTCSACGSALATAAELPPGTLLHDGRFQLLRVLGRGGFGITYEARDLRLQRRVALKELFPESAVRHGEAVVAPPRDRAAFADARDRFLREARILARFSHPGIVRIFETFEEHDTVYLVMELLEGRTLAACLAERATPFTGDEVVDVVRRVGKALAQIHAAGVLHRDVSPSNVMLTENGRLVLIDFGIARPLEPWTRPVTQVMTPGYAPPEQYRSDVSLTSASDVYALAATAYHLATGLAPPAAPERLAGVPLEPPWRVNPTVSKEVSDALLDGLELDVGHRPRDIASLIARLAATSTRPSPRAVVPAPPKVADAPRIFGEPAMVRGADRLAPGPRPVGPHRAGRRKIVVPALVATVAFASATPVVAAALVVLVGLPSLATLGDDIVHRHRLTAGQAWRRWHAWTPGLVLPIRAVRNLGVSVLRGLPALVFGGVVVATAVLVDRTNASPMLRSVVVRVGGAVLGLALAWPATSGGVHFRCGLGVERVVDELLDEKGRYQVRGWALLLVCGAITAASLWLTPEIWPL